MANSIRLTRMGRKQAPFYRLVVCDSRTRRDGEYIESLGYYNPMPDAYELAVDHTRAIDWLSKGAQPTDTARSLLRNEGVLYRWHLMKSGAAEGEVESQVEAFRARRASAAESIRAKTAAELNAWKKSREATAKKVQDDKAKAEASAEAEAAAAAAEEAAPAGEATAETGDAEAGAETSDAAEAPVADSTDDSEKS